MFRLFYGLFLVVICFRGIFGREAVYSIDTSGGLGRRFDGIGGLSAGASSKLLINYPEQQRNEILDFLFKPNFGASLHILKVEIGGDAQSTDGTEASHMRNRTDENYNRGYEWWLMKEAKKRNSDIKLYGLPWGFPGWIGEGTQNPYTDPIKLATYIIKWINGAKIVHDLDIDYIGIWNERMYDVTYVKTLRQQLDASNFTEVMIVAADYFGWDISQDVMKDTEFAKAIYSIGVHYPQTNSAMEAMQTGKPLWSSEDHSYVNHSGDGIASILNKNYVNGFMSSTISWSIIVSYYTGLPDSGIGFMSANEPWSGYYDVEAPIWALAHTTQFTAIGWNYLQHGSGVGNLEQGGSIVSLVSPDGIGLTIVIETVSPTVADQTIILKLTNSFQYIQQVYVWYSKFDLNPDPSNIFVQKSPIRVYNSTIRLTLGTNEVWTISTLETGFKGKTDIPQSKTFPLPYQDDFEKSPLYSEPLNLSPQIGSFEIVKEFNSPNKVVRQMSLEPSVRWCKADVMSRSLAVIGSAKWEDVSIGIRFNLEMTNSSDGIFVGSRINQTGCFSNNALGVFLMIYASNKTFQVNSDIGGRKTLYSGDLINVDKRWNTVEFSVKGEQISAVFNQKILFDRTAKTLAQSGFVGLGTTSLGYADFDSLKIDLPE